MGKHRKDASPRRFGDGKGPGYKNIAPQHQWKKGGPSPNPSGRPKRPPPPPPSLQAEMRAELETFLRSEIPIDGPGGRRSIKVLQALLRRPLGEGVNDGKMALKALQLTLDLLSTLEPSPEPAREDSFAADEDAAIYEATIARELRRRGGGTAEDDSDV